MTDPAPCGPDGRHEAPAPTTDDTTCPCGLLTKVAPRTPEPESPRD